MTITHPLMQNADISNFEMSFSATATVLGFNAVARLLTKAVYNNKKAQLSLTNPRDACEKFARFT